MILTQSRQTTERMLVSTAEAGWSKTDGAGGDLAGAKGYPKAEIPCIIKAIIIKFIHSRQMI